MVSPPPVLSDADHAALGAHGRIAAIVAPHSGHDLGLPAWQTRYPEARSYAPSAALAALTRPGLKSFTDLSGLHAPPEVVFHELLGSKNGGTLVRVLRGARPVLYIDELLGNQAAPPPHLFWKFAFRVSGSAPGLRINRIFKTVLCTEPGRIARTLLEALEGEPILVPSHGAPLRRAEDVARARALLQSIA